MVGGMGKASGKDAEKIADTVWMAQKGSRDAFMELYQLFYHELYAYACYTLHHKQDAEDVVADTIVAAYESIGRLRDVSRFRQWLFKILSNKCRKKLKSYAERNRHHSRSFGGETEQDKVPDISDGKDLEKEATDREWLRDAFAVLTDEERYIVNSFLLAGYRGEEIAESLGIGASTLRSKYHMQYRSGRESLVEEQSLKEVEEMILAASENLSTPESLWPENMSRRLEQVRKKRQRKRRCLAVVLIYVIIIIILALLLL